MHKVGVLFLSCGHSPHQRAMWRRKWSTTERLRPHCCSRRPPSSRRLVECGAKRGRSLSLAAPFLFHAALSARSAAVSGFSSGVGWQLSLHSNSLNVGRVWRKTGAVSLSRRPVSLSRSTQRSLRRRVRLFVGRRVAVVAAFQFLERMWSVQAAVQIAQRREVGQIESV